MKQSDIFELQQNETEKLADGSNLITKPMEEVMHESMIPYAEHVILDRALPRVEDGLKPVQRRILYSMYEQGNTPEKGTRKSARIVGDCMGRYHPHGDSSIYGALVHMAQDFVMNVPLIHGQGNFGNIDGDGAAAMRYTEAKLTPAAMELLRDIDKDTVHFSRNFDDTTKEPDMLPGRFPNLLVNGATGIAVGLATNIPPHNFVEVIDGVIAYIDNKNISLDAMMKIIKGPDFPTGAYVIAGEGLRQAYETGKGKIAIRSKVHIEQGTGDKQIIVIDEIPFQVNYTELLQKIGELRDAKKDQLQGISDIVDESDKEGMRAVIKLRKDADPQKILDVLFKYSPLQQSYGINMVAIADGKPQQMGLLDIIAYYTAYQREVILSRSKYELDEARARAHILQGLVVAVNNIDEVVQIIKKAQSTTEAKDNLRSRFSISEKQAQAILDLRLARLTRLEVTKLENELADLEKQIERLIVIINSRKEQMELIKTELTALKRQFKIPRRTNIYGEDEKVVVPSSTDEKPVENVVVGITAEYTVKRIPQKNFNMSTKNAVSDDVGDMLTSLAATKTDARVMFISNIGNCFRCDVADMPEMRYHDRGVQFKQLFKDAAEGEIPVAMFVMEKDKDLDGEMIIFTRQGMLKRSSWSEYGLLKGYFQGFKCKEGDEVIRVETVRAGTEIFYCTNKGGCTRFDVSEIPLQGRVAGGVRGISMNADEYVMFVGQVDGENGHIAMVTNKGFLKRQPVKEITKHKRDCRGAKGLEFGVNGNCLVYAEYVNQKPFDIVIYDRANTLVVNTDSISIEGKNNQGKLPSGKRGGILVEQVLTFKPEA